MVHMFWTHHCGIIASLMAVFFLNIKKWSNKEILQIADMGIFTVEQKKRLKERLV